MLPCSSLSRHKACSLAPLSCLYTVFISDVRGTTLALQRRATHPFSHIIPYGCGFLGLGTVLTVGCAGDAIFAVAGKGDQRANGVLPSSGPLFLRLSDIVRSLCIEKALGDCYLLASVMPSFAHMAGKGDLYIRYRFSIGGFPSHWLHQLPDEGLLTTSLWSKYPRRT